MADLVPTVLGPVPADDLGRILPHEHILGAYGRGLSLQLRFDPPPVAEIREQHLPLLQRLPEHGCRTIVEVSPTGLRRREDVELWVKLSRATGINIVACTGYYVGAMRPAAFADLPATAVADGMIAEATDGILGTGVRAGIIKIAVETFDAGDRKLCRAAAIAQRQTGLSITTHTCSPDVRLAVLDYLEGAGVPPSRIYLGHADDNATLPELLALVRRGCNVLLTLWGIQNTRRIGWVLPALPRYHSPGLVVGLIAEGHGSQVLVSIDFAAGVEDGYYGVEGRDYLYMYSHVLGTLRRMGAADEDIERVMRDNPRRMLVG
ncbi:MAG: phosphotriesterase family protein [Anaerolineae bacterium]